jgi:hypothetical protein
MGQSSQAQVSAEVPTGTHRNVRLANVPADTRLAIAVRVSTRLKLSLLTEADGKRYPDTPEPVFSAPVESTLSFAVTVPATGNYVVILDNGRGEATSAVRMVVRATRTKPLESPPQMAPPAPSTDQPSHLRRRPEIHEM